MTTSSQKYPNISARQLHDFATSLLHKGGFARDHAEETAALLVWANTRGVHTHGVMRIPRYLEMVREGSVRADARVEVVRRNGAVCLLDANRAPGAVAMNRAVQTAAELSDQFGIGWCSIRRTSHTGAVGYFALQLTQMGKVGLIMTASRPLMGYHGAKGEVLSTNPLAIGVPLSGGQPPMLLDMSTAAVPLGRIMAAREANQPIPRGWGLDAEGAETTDPHQVTTLVPMAGPKGTGLSLMIEILCSLLAGNPNIAPALTGGKPGGFNGAVLAISPEAFGERDTFLTQVQALANAIHDLPPAPGFDRVLLPGERGFMAQQASEQAGVTVPAATVARLLKLAGELNVDPPASWATPSGC